MTNIEYKYIGDLYVQVANVGTRLGGKKRGIVRVQYDPETADLDITVGGKQSPVIQTLIWVQGIAITLAVLEAAGLPISGYDAAEFMGDISHETVQFIKSFIK